MSQYDIAEICGERVIAEMYYEGEYMPEPVTSPALFLEPGAVVEPTFISTERGIIWRASATIADNGTFSLWIANGIKALPVHSGSFVNPRALVKYAKEAAAKHYPGIRPIKDDFTVLSQHSPGGIARPTCYLKGSPLPQCGACPYVEDCFRPSMAATLRSGVLPDGAIPVDTLNTTPIPEEPSTEEIQEENLIKRLKDKMSKKTWEN